MKKEHWPPRIFLQREDADNRPDVGVPDGATWCADKINDSDVEYVRLDLYRAEVSRAKRKAKRASHNGEPPR